MQYLDRNICRKHGARCGSATCLAGEKFTILIPDETVSERKFTNIDL